MPVVDQLNIRFPNKLKAVLDAIAVLSGESTSQMCRENLEEFVRQRAAETRDRTLDPTANETYISEEDLREQVSGFLSAIVKNESLSVRADELFTARSKALWVVLSWLWSEHMDGSTEITPNDGPKDVEFRRGVANWLRSQHWWVDRADITRSDAHQKELKTLNDYLADPESYHTKKDAQKGKKPKSKSTPKKKS